MKKEKYLPLKIAEHLSRENNTEIFRQMMCEAGFNIDALTSEDIADFVFSQNFCTPNYSGPFQTINRTLLREDVKHSFAGQYPDGVFEKLDYRIEMMDCFGLHPIVDMWAQHKQVYKVDPGFYDSLSETAGFGIPDTTFKYLPDHALYIDLSECEQANPIDGAFVYATKDNQVVVSMMTTDETSFSFYSNFRYRKGMAEMYENSVLSTAFRSLDYNKASRTGFVKDQYSHDPRPKIIRAILQLLMFLSSQKPDVQENEITKKTYRPSSTVKNKFSEVQMWDVGVRYGKAISFAKKEAEKKTKEENENPGTKINFRKPVRPHVRCAHWQRLHVGKGRKEIRVNWIPPVFVCGGKEIPVTIHEVKA